MNFISFILSDIFLLPPSLLYNLLSFASSTVFISATFFPLSPVYIAPLSLSLSLFILYFPFFSSFYSRSPLFCLFLSKLALHASLLHTKLYTYSCLFSIASFARHLAFFYFFFLLLIPALFYEFIILPAFFHFFLTLSIKPFLSLFLKLFVLFIILKT